MPTTQRSSLLSNSRDAPSRALGRQSNAVNITEFFRGPTEPMLQPDTFHTILKDEIKGLQTQLKNIEALPPTRTQQVLSDECLQTSSTAGKPTVGDGGDRQDISDSSCSEEIERQLGLPATTISSQLTKTFLTAGFQHYQRSGMTTGNAPQNFEPINCPPSLSRTDGSCCYRLHKEVPPRRFSLMPKFFRFRDRMRNNASYNIKFPPPVLANTNFSNPVVPSLPLPIAFPGFTAGGPHGYTHESPDFQQAPRTFHAGAASGMPTAGQGDPVTASYAVEEHPSHPYGSAVTPSPPVRPVVEIRPYQTDKGPATSPQGPEVQQTEGIGNSDQTNGSRIEAVTERRSSHLVHRRASSAGPATVVPLGSAFDSGLAHESIQEPHRSKSLAESNYVQPGAVGDSFGGEPCVQDYYVPEPRHALSPYDARGSLAGKSSWPAPSSWVSSNAFLPSGADIKRTEPHAILTESGMPPVAGNRLMTIGPWESKVDSSEPSVAGHNAFSHEPPPVAVNGDGSRFSGSQQVRGTDRGPWQYMVQED
uniref:Uncharacterized protein n=1 Tax=Toxoplasma gondii (strain ATCC 50861 / VEG) TaxID=432359 RepID=A0A0F7V9L4_TOXGV|nr:TPA: hypothetical protein BN1205_037945 [Toxoplasma gondii VEG]